MKTKNIVRIVLAVATAVSLYFVPWTMVKAQLTPAADTVQEQVNEATDLGFEGIIVYVDQAGKPPAFYAAGWHDRDKKIEANPHALYKIASISKLYIAAATAKAVNAGKLSLDKTLAQYLPEMVGKIENAETITLRMLVRHRSGIPDYSYTPDFWNKVPDSNIKSIELIYGLPAEFAPDASYKYSNTNYSLLGEILDQELGYSHHQYIKDEILEPLGLKNTFSLLSEVENMDDLMSGYYVGIEKDLKTDSYVNPGGSMIATAEDVGIFLRALNDGSLFTDAERELYASLYTYDHTGLIPGYQSIARYIKDMDTVVVQFTNTTNFTGPNWGLSEVLYRKIVKILSDK
ncbi:serine hydrolase [Jiulongibacter sediminis]|mgnify:CR=1 FL=1|jgi:CubicO group peptidase (beta-lactamase class C family)|uniref:serine hydrolase domain-containing protein n=1 Tax=Jiulongibacter sediminis TaxID=1605367 RepID=UPI0026EAB6DA|nr:serine hydrolase domain-containing protein [Jiulongibacter sediminis]